MNKTTENEIREVVDAYCGKQQQALDPDLVAVCAAAMKPRDGATPEERQAFENMQRIATGTV